MEILNYKEILNDPKGIIGKFDVFLGPVSGITYPNFSVVRGKTGGFFVRRPSYLKSDDGLGNKTWGTYPEMSEEKWKSLSSQLIDMLKPLVNQIPF